MGKQGSGRYVFWGFGEEHVRGGIVAVHVGEVFAVVDLVVACAEAVPKPRRLMARTEGESKRILNDC